MRRVEHHDVTGRRGRSGAVRLLDAATILLTFAAVAALVCAYLARWLSPAGGWWPLAFAGIAAPGLWLLNVILALYWAARWRRWALLPAFAALLGAGWVSLFFKPTLSRHPGERDHAQVVMSYNVAGFRYKPHAVDSIAAMVRREDPDILCIQEFECYDVARRRVIDSLIGLPHVHHSIKWPNSTGGGLGVAVYSRWRIIDHGDISFEDTANSAMWVDVVAPHDTVRVFCCHLQSTSVDRNDLAYIASAELDAATSQHARTIAGKLRRNFARRAVQADSVAVQIAASPHPIVLCGDFNDTAMSYAYTTVRGRLADAFARRGRGVPSTYKGLFGLFRIDYVLAERSFDILSYDSPDGEYSDHNPVVVGMRL